MATKPNPNFIKLPKGCKVRHVDFGGRVWTVVLVPWPRKAVGPLGKEAVGTIDEDNNIILVREGPNAIISFIHEISHWAYPSLEDDPVTCPKCEFNFGIQNDLLRGDGLLTEALTAFGVDLSPITEGYE